jgi:HEAT repeat protein
MRTGSSKTQKPQRRKNIKALVAYGAVSWVVSVFGCSGLIQKAPAGRDLAEALKPQAVRIVQECLVDDSPQVRAIAIEVVVAVRQVGFMPRVQRLLKDDFVPVRFMAALAIGDMQYQLAKSEVMQLLEDREDVRIGAAYAMSKLGSPEYIRFVRQAVTNENQRVRANAVLLLGKGGDETDLKLLYWAMRDEGSDDKVRFNAAEAVALLGDERIYPKLWSMLISAYHDDRVFGIGAMAAIGTLKAKDALITMLDDDVPEVRLAAAEKLGMLGDTSGESEVLDILRSNLTSQLDREGLERVNVRAALAIGEIGTPALIEFLPQLLDSESKFVRLAAAKAVFQCEMNN